MRIRGDGGAVQLRALQFSMVPSLHLQFFLVLSRRARRYHNLSNAQQRQALDCMMAFPLLNTKAIPLFFSCRSCFTRAADST